MTGSGEFAANSGWPIPYQAITFQMDRPGPERWARGGGRDHPPTVFRRRHPPQAGEPALRYADQAGSDEVFCFSGRLTVSWLLQDGLPPAPPASRRETETVP